MEEATIDITMVHWKIGRVGGCGSWLPLDAARAWVESSNKKWGDGSHWIEVIERAKHYVEDKG